jgi:ferric-dicitrate binding protein FerR (iron transport regulator)
MIDAPDQRMDAAADEEATLRLLRIAGPRETVSDQRAARVKAVVQSEWRARRRRRATSTRVILAGAILTAASVGLLVGRFNRVERSSVPLGGPVAVVEQIQGTPHRGSDRVDPPTTARLSLGETIRAGEWITTDANARTALRFADGTSVRLDVGSRLRPISSSGIELSAGAVYVDTVREAGRFEVRTAMATAFDVGTQFEVRLLDRTVRLRVRTGIVELKDDTRSVSGRAGTEITLSATGAVSRPIVAHGSEWEWVASISPPLEMEGASVAAFLERVAREQGWTVRYADPALAREASGIVLHGSVHGLHPREIVDVAIAASGLRHRFENGELVVLRAMHSREADGER